MTHKKLLMTVLLALIAWGNPLIISAQAREPLMVFAAASLSDALKELAVDFKKEYKVDVVFNFGGSSALRFQIEKGTPCDIFLSADKISTEQLIAKNFADQKYTANILVNRLIVVAKTSSAAPLKSLYDMQFNVGDHIAIADPQLSPAGVYAMQALTHADLLTKMSPYLVPAMDVRSALAFVRSGNAQYAIVYQTDIVGSSDVKSVYVIPESLYEPIIYSAAVINREENVIPARNFLSFLLSEHSKMVFKKYGFQSF